MKVINKAEFDELKNQGVLLVDFFATWCGPCKMIAPFLEELEKTFEGKATIVKVDVDQEEGLTKEFSIMSVPTLLLFKDGKLIREVGGFQPKPQLEAMIKSAL
ncbi:MAG: thioredoxin [Erysipelotrichaceae bacterium]